MWSGYPDKATPEWCPNVRLTDQPAPLSDQFPSPLAATNYPWSASTFWAFIEAVSLHCSQRFHNAVNAINCIILDTLTRTHRHTHSHTCMYTGMSTNMYSALKFATHKQNQCNVLALKSPCELIQFTFALVIVVIVVVSLIVVVAVVVTDVALSHYINFINMKIM